MMCLQVLRAPRDIRGVHGAEQCLLRHDRAHRHTGHQDRQEDLGGSLAPEATLELQRLTN